MTPTCHSGRRTAHLQNKAQVESGCIALAALKPSTATSWSRSNHQYGTIMASAFSRRAIVIMCTRKGWLRNRIRIASKEPNHLLRMDAQKIDVGAAGSVTGILQVPERASACYVVAHGAGAGITHPFMTAVADGLYARQISTLRYHFPYMERGLKRPDSPAAAHATVRAAVSEAKRQVPSLPLFAGGKSFGGRMTSQAQAEAPLPYIQGLVFFGFPLHVAGKPSMLRARHLMQVQVPMLFLQGTRDTLADIGLMATTTGALGQRATLVEIDDGDHSFHVRVRSGGTDAQALSEMLDAVGAWISAQT
jgi:predicted alpha/beta-hydrolase family hydrolase